jgi:hypothetical protein
MVNATVHPQIQNTRTVGIHATGLDNLSFDRKDSSNFQTI